MAWTMGRQQSDAKDTIPARNATVMVRMVTALLGARCGGRALLLGGHQSAALNLPLVHVDFAIGQPTVKNLHRELTACCGHLAAAARQQPPDGPHDQREHDDPEHDDGKACEWATHFAAVPTHHGELLLALSGAPDSPQSAMIDNEVAQLARW